MIAGLAIGLWLLPSERIIAGIHFDIHTLLFAAIAVIVGFQAVNFAVFTKIFAINEGLLPEDARLRRMMRAVSLEVGLIVGGLLMLIGIVGSIAALSGWGSRSFGPLDPTRTMRLVIPTVTALTLGFEIILSSFFLSILGMKRR